MNLPFSPPLGRIGQLTGGDSRNHTHGPWVGPRAVLANRGLVNRPSSGSSPFVLCLKHVSVLDHWAVCRCFAKLFGEASTAPFIAFLIHFLQVFAYWNKGWSASLRRFAKSDWRSSGFSFYVLSRLFVPFCA
uniref:Uncharacterized protein n=1 Tax=Solanum tuberosum TaxID=4113 RepID=M1D8R9_SOLTU